MKIILLNEKQIGFITETNLPNIYITGNQKGVLRIGNKLFFIENSESLPVLDMVGFVPCYFENEYGEIYDLGTMKIEKGKLYSLPVCKDEIVNLNISIDNLIKEVAEIKNEIIKIKSNVEYDSIGFLTGEKK